MLNTVFESVFTAAGGFTAGTFLICVGSAVVLGLIIAAVHIKTTHTSTSYAVTLAILPAIVAVVIMMVNGNLGAGIAVAGAFSLVRFRSAPGSAKEIASIFLAMATGLACGMGYPAFGLIFAVILCLLIVILNALHFGEKRFEEAEKILKITIPEDLNFTNLFDDLFEKYTRKSRLLNIKTINLGSLNRLTYNIVLKDTLSEKDFIDDLRCRNGNLEIVLTDSAAAATEL
ncbi:MAG: DUF4956 domain-containing protein [Lachnospiraceae bacterium]|nr:DUF4956 domain-containing protein [Lachnospiraceae bacterium]